MKSLRNIFSNKNDEVSPVEVSGLGNAEQIKEQQSKQAFYKPAILLIVLFALVSFNFLKKNVWTPLTASETKENASTGKSNRKGKKDRSAPVGLTQAQNVRLRASAEQFLVSDDGRWLVSLNESDVIAYKTGADFVVSLKNVPADLFRFGQFLPNGEIALGGESGVGIWNLESGNRRLSLNAPGGVETLGVSPNGQLIAGISREDGRIRLWEVQSGTVLKESAPNQNSLRPTLEFESDEKLLVYEITEGSGRILRVSVPGLAIEMGELMPFADTNLRYAVGGRWLEAGSSSREIEEPQLLVFDGRTAQEVGRIGLGAFGTGGMVDETHAVTVSDDGEINLVDLSIESGQVISLAKLDRKSRLGAISANGKTVVVKIGEREVVVFSAPVS